MYPLRSAIRAQASRSHLQRASKSATTSLLSAASTRRPVSSSRSTLQAVRGLHSSLNACDKKWINQKGNEKTSTIEENEKGKAKTDGQTASSVTTSEKDNGAAESGEKPVSEVVPEENGIADERETPSSPSTSESKSKATTTSSSSSSSSSNGAAQSSSASSASTPPSSSSGNGDDSIPKSNNAITKLSIPEIYPQVLALPITRRPLFPGFYKAVTITSPPVIKAIRTLLQRGQPYIGAFLLKDSDSDSDVITSPDQVYPVGVFAQITSVFGSSDNPAGTPHGQLAAESEGDKKPETLTAVLYPHRRIRIDELLTGANSTTLLTPEDIIGEPATSPSTASAVVPDGQQKPESEVASFEKEEVPSPEQVAHDLHDGGRPDSESAVSKSPSDPAAHATKEPAAPHSSIGFLHSLVPQVSIVNVSNLQLEPYKKDSQIVRAVMSELISVFKDIAQLAPIFREQITSFTMSQSTSNVFDEPDKLADFAAAVSTGEVTELQAVLESLSIEDRLQKALLILKKELINAQLQSKISKDVESKIQKRQREYYLMEQLKGIKKELGMESDGKDKLVERFKEKASKLAMPEGVKKVFDEEINKLMHLEPAASEFNVTRNYLDWLTQIPWGAHSPENFDIQHAIKVLDEDHYGLKDVKDRILEFLAVGKLRGTVEGKIICMVGPPGVGKTSIGKSIARALDRQFYRFSVGGLTDVAEIKGHRRTYVGAMPGKPIQALKKVGTENPLILIDEVDKIGRGHNGDPSSALLEMLDPEQNSSFLDH
ncbi:ATP-dependent Lon protease pim1 [Naganishia cerealis]|uniref:ATP-dependent Lon protease pim1 n=1 Tax=Naganishia cerealis TaxID=610337 RepID=A0ACC2V8R8_9TREE|nr:ATP-dependent Lon protease pim1 [Naganishia cerealis]